MTHLFEYRVYHDPSGVHGFQLDERQIEHEYDCLPSELDHWLTGQPIKAQCVRCTPPSGGIRVMLRSDRSRDEVERVVGDFLRHLNSRDVPGRGGGKPCFLAAKLRLERALAANGSRLRAVQPTMTRAYAPLDGAESRGRMPLFAADFLRGSSGDLLHFFGYALRRGYANEPLHP